MKKFFNNDNEKKTKLLNYINILIEHIENNSLTSEDKKSLIKVLKEAHKNVTRC